MAIRHKINWSLQMRYCRFPLNTEMRLDRPTQPVETLIETRGKASRSRFNFLSGLETMFIRFSFVFRFLLRYAIGLLVDPLRPSPPIYTLYYAKVLPKDQRNQCVITPGHIEVSWDCGKHFACYMGRQSGQLVAVTPPHTPQSLKLPASRKPSKPLRRSHHHHQFSRKHSYSLHFFPAKTTRRRLEETPPKSDHISSFSNKTAESRDWVPSFAYSSVRAD